VEEELPPTHRPHLPSQVLLPHVPWYSGVVPGAQSKCEAFQHWPPLQSARQEYPAAHSVQGEVVQVDAEEEERAEAELLEGRGQSVVQLQ
jgi:hypothetical protein